MLNLQTQREIPRYLDLLTTLLTTEELSLTEIEWRLSRGGLLSATSTYNVQADLMQLVTAGLATCRDDMSDPDYPFKRVWQRSAAGDALLNEPPTVICEGLPLAAPHALH